MCAWGNKSAVEVNRIQNSRNISRNVYRRQYTCSDAGECIQANYNRVACRVRDDWPAWTCHSRRSGTLCRMQSRCIRYWGLSTCNGRQRRPSAASVFSPDNLRHIILLTITTTTTTTTTTSSFTHLRHFYFPLHRYQINRNPCHFQKHFSNVKSYVRRTVVVICSFSRLQKRRDDSSVTCHVSGQIETKLLPILMNRVQRDCKAIAQYCQRSL